MEQGCAEKCQGDDSPSRSNAKNGGPGDGNQGDEGEQELETSQDARRLRDRLIAARHPAQPEPAIRSSSWARISSSGMTPAHAAATRLSAVIRTVTG